MEEVLNKLAQKGLTGIETLEKMAPQLIQEYLKWELLSGIIGLIITLFFMAVLGYFIRKAYYEPKEKIYGEMERKDWTVFVMAIGGMIFIMLGIVLIDISLNILKIIYAPKIYLLDALTKIIK